MKLMSLFTLPAAAFSLLPLLMCTNSSNSVKKNPIITSTETADTSLPAFQKLVDSAAQFINEYNILHYALGKNKKKADSIASIQKELSAQLSLAEDYNIISIYTGDTTKKAILRAKEQLKEIHQRIFQLQQSRDKLTSEMARLKQEREDAERQLPTKENEWQKISKKLVSFTNRFNGPLELTFNGKKYKTFIAASTLYNIFIQNNPKGAFTFLKFKEVVQKNQKTAPSMITNGGMFTAAHLPQGILIHNSKTVAPIDSTTEKKDGNFYLYPNGIFLIDSANGYQVLETKAYIKEYLAKKKTPLHATQSGPMLVHNRLVNEAFTPASANLNIRSGAGVMTKDRAIFVISEQPVNFYEMALLYRYIFNCTDALYLDGAISKMYIEGEKKMPEGEFGPMIAIFKK